MSYGSVRDDEFTRRLDAKIATFVAGYQTGRPTIILFPGGMGSQLFYYNQTYPATPVPLSSELLWMAFDFFAAGAEKIWLKNDLSDANLHYVVADDAIEFLVVQPYLGFRWWCWLKKVNLFVFGYDWRRSAQEAATYFLGTFMPHLDQAIVNKTGASLQNFYLVGHSAGGMTVKLILNDTTNPYVQRMTRAITVASPFYGYAGQIHRFHTGILALNWNLAEPTHQNRRMAEIIATMPGGYEFLYLDHQTYLDNYAGFTGANEDPDYRLPNYPCMDAVTNTPADPYFPTPDGQKVRYPVAQAGLPLTQLLSNGLTVSQDVAKPLDGAVAARFYSIRGVQTRYNGAQKLQKTAVRSTWQRIEPANYNPDAANRPKLMVDTLGYGDGVQPAWTTRLLQLQENAYNASADRHVITLANDSVDHMFMMNERAVHNAIGKLLGLPATLMALEVQQAPTPATPAQFQEFLEDLDLQQKRRKRTPAEQLEYIRRKYSLADLNRLLLRGYIDLLKTPTQLETSAQRKRAKPKKKAARRKR